MSKKVKIKTSWKELLNEEFEKEYFSNIKSFLKKEIEDGKQIFPPGKLIFNAFDLTAVTNTKIVILGQDPYHNPGEAMGLSFSVPRGVKVPPSLANIYKELKNDIGIDIPSNGDLTLWAQQGVLLLNAFLTVEKNKPLSHSKIGWHIFTDQVIKKLSESKDNIVFMLWGNFAKGKEILIDHNKHLVLKSAHPSPLAGNAFFHNHHFSQANDYLEKTGQARIDFRL